MTDMANKLQALKEKAYKKKKGMPWYGVNVTHRISIRVVDLIKKEDIDPDLITLVSIFVGLGSALLFMIPNVVIYFMAAIMLEIYYVLDAVDGQYARLKERTSVTGAYFDYISNHIVQSLVFAGMGIGLFNLTWNVWYMIAGFLAAWGMVLMYVIHDARASILFNRGDVPAETGNVEKGGEEQHSLAKKVFMAMHKTGTFPTTMNIITLLSLISLFANKGLTLFKFAVLYYAIILNIVWAAKLFQFVKNKQLDQVQKGG